MLTDILSMCLRGLGVLLYLLVVLTVFVAISPFLLVFFVIACFEDRGV